MHTTTLSAVRLAAALAALKTAAASAQTIIYVDDDAAPGGNGHSWYSAFDDLVDALAAAASGDQGAEVRIAQGTYTPDQGTGDRLRSFEVRAPNVASGMTVWLRGAFGGIGAPFPDEVDPVKYATILSGDLKGDDKPGFVNRADNSRRVLDVNITGPLQPSFVMDGLTISAAWGETAESRGGGAVMSVADSQWWKCRSEVRDCRFIDNFAAAGSAGAWLAAGHISLKRCTFAGNRTPSAGGGLGVTSEDARLEDSVVSDNTALDGGGISIDTSPAGIEVYGGSIVRNSAVGYGGGLHSMKWASVADALIAENSAGGEGGGVWTADWVSVQRCTIAGNSAGADGGGVSAGPASFIANCVMSCNAASGRGGAASLGGYYAHILNSTIFANHADSGGGIAIAGTGLTRLSNTILWANSAPAGAQAWITGPNATLTVEYCDTQDGQSGIMANGAELDWRPTSFAADPLFADPDGPDNDPKTWADNDLHIAPDSPCIEAGPEDWDYYDGNDAFGLPRMVNADCDGTIAIDIGAHEFQPEGCPPPAPRFYVDADAPLGGDGLAWATAFSDLQDALRTPGVTEVWVAAGVYRPDGGTGDRARSFHMSCDAKIYGGFAGFETDVSERDPAANATILTGDLAGDDGPGFENNSDNAYRVVSTGHSALTLDGFTITGGNAAGGPTDTGAGMQCVWGDLTLANCRFVWNAAPYADAGLSASGHAINISDCVFADNATGRYTLAWSAGASIGGHIATLVRCDFLRNVITGDYNAFGGALAVGSDSVFLDRCRFIGNSAATTKGNGADGGGVFLTYQVDTVQMTNCLFLGNVASGPAGSEGGAMYFEIGWSDGIHLANNSIVGNRADGPSSKTGGLRLANGGMELANSILWANSASGVQDEAAQVSNEYGPLFVNYSLIQAWTGNLGGDGNSGADPLPLDPLGPDGLPGTGDDDWRLSPSSPAIDAADNAAIPNGIATDLAGANRFVDDPSTKDTGHGNAPIADVGAYEFQPPWCADCDGSGALDLFDYLCFLNHFISEDPAADCTADGALDLFDFLCFTNAFNAGC